MQHAPPSREALRCASDAVVEFALIAFEPQFLRWTPAVNCSVVMMVWNACRDGELPEAFGAPGDPALQGLLEVLAGARCKRWADASHEVLDLGIHHVRGELVFTFRLTWDGGETTWPCEITVDMPVMPSAFN